MPGDPKSESNGTGGSRGLDGSGEDYEGADRGFLSVRVELKPFFDDLHGYRI